MVVSDIPESFRNLIMLVRFYLFANFSLDKKQKCLKYYYLDKSVQNMTHDTPFIELLIWTDLACTDIRFIVEDCVSFSLVSM